MGLNLAKALRLDHIPPPRVAFVGAGGKTTALFQLAKELSPCIVTTTTHLGAWQVGEADQHIIIRKPEDINQLEEIAFSGVILVTGEEKGNRLTSLANESLAWLEQFCNYHSLPLLIEADGARKKPLKAPKEHEPVIPNFVGTVIVVAGLSGIGKLLSDENVYNAEIFAKLGKMEKGKKIAPDNLANLLMHEEGGLKNIPEKARRIALLNQADTSELQGIAGKLAKDLLPKFDAAITANLQQSTFKPSSIQTLERPAAIILAAGSSTRFGESKQLLDYHGKPFFRVVAERALEAELSPVIVVTGAERKEIALALEDLPVKIMHNPDWGEGQSSSIRAGVNGLPAKAGSAIFLLADQPQVTSTVMRALVEEHRRTLKPVIAPMVEDRRANPVLFDRITFPALLELKGDIGGRGIFSKFSPNYILWLDSSLLLDVDTPEDYQKLIKR
ncbi:MAG: putative selenium-dependent hydroxylase accessory protein YqeC [Anaerolineae bacterium]|nr:putative selenium-dependent hydroxylase accessory protein YqeC [Anaerolineae bacterium]MBT4309335.1 putative selenium-dependent hydroxylase accessory protein YqeC [Anaerolineae bacterium]MBT4458180.1 putative selenium-dependent hydroxylase accessory protein YqeC [Anaerolineae bacterium]MBT6062636.1 putative selenium-dependent hydroxylase accessory protein YqeC [Anaerolineae bacterium]MBT6321624.1 putative selenium-dependent hydroxylase accessory protein YqeC [Anaerolineae bacterium]